MSREPDAFDLYHAIVVAVLWLVTAVYCYRDWKRKSSPPKD